MFVEIILEWLMFKCCGGVLHSSSIKWISEFPPVRWEMGHKMIFLYSHILHALAPVLRRRRLQLLRGCEGGKMEAIKINLHSVNEEVYYRKEGEHSDDLNAPLQVCMNKTASLFQSAFQQLCSRNDPDLCRISASPPPDPPGLVVSVSAVTLNRQDRSSDAVCSGSFLSTLHHLPPLP